MPRIVFYALRDLHVPVLLPVYREVARLGRFDAGFVAPPYRASDGATVQEGLSPETLAALGAEHIPFWGHANPAAAACVVTADACYDRVEGWGPVVCIGHGTISKGFYFTNRPSVRRENFARVLCVPGPWYVTSYGGHVFTRIVPTGFSKMDELVHSRDQHRESVLSALGLDPSKRTLLFAPTFNPELTSLALLADEWAKIDEGPDQVIFKLHGATSEEWKQRYRRLASASRHLRYAEDASLSPYMLASDVIISDVSSAYVEGLVTGHPVIVVNNPAVTTYPLFNPRDVEYLAREAAYQVDSGDGLRQVLEQLRTGDPLAKTRARWADRLFAPRDGRNSARIAAEIARVAGGGTSHGLPRPDDRMSVFVPEHAVDLDTLERNLKKAWTPLAVFRRGAGPATLAGIPVHTLAPGHVPPQPFINMTGEHHYPDGWDVLWFMASHFNPGATGVFGPLLPDRPGSADQRHTRFFPNAPTCSDNELQQMYKHQAFDQLAATPMLQRDGAIVTTGVSRAIARTWVDRTDDSSSLAAAAADLRARGHVVGVVPAFFATARHAAAAPALAAPTDARASAASTDLLFYCFKNVHLALFEPVIAAVRRLAPSTRIAFSAPRRDAAAREGLTDGERDSFARAMNADWIHDAAAIRAGTVVIADCVADRLRGHRRIVNLGHGLISKGQYYGSDTHIGRENLADAICVPGPWHAERLRRRLYIPIHVTGMSKLDRLFTPFDEHAFRASNHLPADGPILLWCPTFNPELSSLPVIGPDIRRLADFGHVVIKLHGTTDLEIVRRLQDRLDGDARVTFVDPARDATPFMRCARVLITDVSSVMFEFAALDRPVILVDNPHQTEYANYDARDVEYALRDIGVRVRSVDELVTAVLDELAQPERHHAARRRATERMFAATDGRNSDRIARVLLERPRRPQWLGAFDAVLAPHLNADDVAYCAAGLQAAASIIGPAGCADQAGGTRYLPYADAAGLDRHLRASQSENVVIFQRRARMVGDWRAPLFGPLYAHEQPNRVAAPLSTGDAHAACYVGHHLKRDRLRLPRHVGIDVLAGVIRLTNPGEWTPTPHLDSPVIALRRGEALNGWRDATGAVSGVLVGDALACE